VNRVWADEEIDYLKNNYNIEEDVSILAKKFGRTENSIKHKAARLGIKVRDGRRRIRKIKNKEYWYYCIKRETVLEHRMLMEKKLGRKLNSNDIVHHLDGDTLNNSLANLIVTTRAEHMGRYHLDICLEKLDKINNK